MSDGYKRTIVDLTVSSDEEGDTSNSTTKQAEEEPSFKKPRIAELDGHAEKVIDSGIRFTHCPSQPNHNNVHSTTLKSLFSLVGELDEVYIFNYDISLGFILNNIPSHAANVPVTIVGLDPVNVSDKSLFPHLSFVKVETQDFGCHHTKMFVLFGINGTAKVIIHTANMIEHDWLDITNACWISPTLYKKNTRPGCSSTCRFEQDLMRYLEAYKKPEVNKLINRLKQYDMSDISVLLVASVPGSYENHENRSFGHLRLKTLLEEFGDAILNYERRVNQTDYGKEEIIAQYSSVGTNTRKWIFDQMDTSFQPVVDKTAPRRPLKLVFPTKEDVRCAHMGWRSSKGLWLSHKKWLKQQVYTRDMMHRWACAKAGRGGTAPHIKTFTRVNPVTKNISWFLLTSANWSAAAWGNIPQNNPEKITMHNYELGVLFIPAAMRSNRNQEVVLKTATPSDLAKMNLRNLPIPPTESGRMIVPIRLPYDLPLTLYSDEDEPFCKGRNYQEPDAYGFVLSEDKVHAANI